MMDLTFLHMELFLKCVSNLRKLLPQLGHAVFVVFTFFAKVFSDKKMLVIPATPFWTVLWDVFLPFLYIFWQKGQHLLFS